jgi:acyl-CoA dehydrogenase
MTAGHAFGIPPIIKFGSKALHEKFLPDLLPGKKRACIAITEPGAGSDVANIATTAKKTADGKHYIINGEKKWITNGFWSDYAAMAVRTGGKGASGLSMIVCPLKGYPGVTMRRLKVQGQIAAGTTYIELDDVKVPVENLIGEEGKGMGYVMVSVLSATCVLISGPASWSRCDRYCNIHTNHISADQLQPRTPHHSLRRDPLRPSRPLSSHGIRNEARSFRQDPR